MKRRSKQVVLEAVQELITGYEKNTLSHTTSNCPLCKIYFSDKTYDNRSCGKCINTIFEEGSSNDYGCSARGREFPNLNIDYDSWKDKLKQNKHLAFFWKQVYDILETSRPSEVLNLTPETIKLIRGVAKLSNDIQLNITE